MFPWMLKEMFKETRYITQIQLGSCCVLLFTGCWIEQQDAMCIKKKVLHVTSFPVVNMGMNEGENADSFTSLWRCLGHVPPGGHPRADLGQNVSRLDPGLQMTSTKTTTNFTNWVQVSPFPLMLNSDMDIVGIPSPKIQVIWTDLTVRMLNSPHHWFLSLVS